MKISIPVVVWKSKIKRQRGLCLESDWMLHNEKVWKTFETISFSHHMVLLGLFLAPERFLGTMSPLIKNIASLTTTVVWGQQRQFFERAKEPRDGEYCRDNQTLKKTTALLLTTNYCVRINHLNYRKVQLKTGTKCVCCVVASLWNTKARFPKKERIWTVSIWKTVADFYANFESALCKKQLRLVFRVSVVPNSYNLTSLLAKSG